VTEGAKVLLGLLERRHTGYAGRAIEVAAMAAEITERLGLPKERVERVWLAGMLQDVGMVVVRDAVLEKTEPLTTAERAEIEQHPGAGARLLERWGLGDVAEWVRGHHERHDGLGYPDGLLGFEIPFEGRILAVAGAYGAMMSDRVYASGLTRAEARGELLRGAGSQFDPQVVEAAVAVLDAGWISPRC
jgi:HD-GYP domain-containing protein (c-di-GMP phosphodiesterase class II)